MIVLKILRLAALALALLSGSTNGFVIRGLLSPSAAAFMLQGRPMSTGDQDESISRRSLLGGLLSASVAVVGLPSVAGAQDEIDWTPFNGLIFNYRNSDQNTGLDASTLDEPSVPFLEFAERLTKGEVKFVEFMAPDGDAAYVTFNDKESKPIRIGEGYPIEQHDGWSSPAFVVRAVKNQGVPYKFTLPALTAYKE